MWASITMPLFKHYHGNKSTSSPERVYSKELIELLFVQPYCKVKQLVDADIAKRQTAAEYLRELEKIGILKARKWELPICI